MMEGFFVASSPFFLTSQGFGFFEQQCIRMFASGFYPLVFLWCFQVYIYDYDSMIVVFLCLEEDPYDTELY